MAVYLLKDYGGYAASTTIPRSFADTVEADLITQKYAVTAGGGETIPSNPPGNMQLATQGGNVSLVSQNGLPATYYQGPLTLPVINLGSAALTTYETNGTAPVAGSMNLTEIHVPYTQTWTGIGVLNGTVVGTDNHLVALYGSDGSLLANSAVAGTLSAGASVMQNRAFTAPITLIPGRYFLGVQSNGTTATLRHLLSANGANVCTSVTAGVFGTVPATLTPPATHTTAVGVIAQLYV